MNFATLKGLTIPEGNVTQIADANGRVIWKQAPSGANVKVTLNNGGTLASQKQSPYASFYIDGVKHNISEEITVPIGTVLSFSCSKQYSSVSSTTAGIYVNDAEVTYTTNGQYSASYEYTVTGDIEIVLSNSMTMSGSGSSMRQNFVVKIHITEL